MGREKIGCLAPVDRFRNCRQSEPPRVSCNDLPFGGDFKWKSSRCIGRIDFENGGQRTKK